MAPGLQRLLLTPRAVDQVTDITDRMSQSRNRIQATTARITAHRVR